MTRPARAFHTCLSTRGRMAVSALALIAGTVPAFAQDAPASAEGRLEEIVVTAQRKEENLQRVPVAVTALSSAALDNARILNVNNLSGYAPNVQITNQGLSSIPTVQIRGISSGVSDNAVDPKIGIYLDGVYIGRTVGAVFDLADLQRVEVLRGPQGTLFGRNSTGGAISLVSAAPSGKLGIKQQLSYGNGDALRSRTIIDLPALGPLKLKFSYLHDEIRGDTRNLAGGRTLDFSQVLPSFGTIKYADRLGSKNVDAFQIAARINATDDLTIDYRYDHTDSRNVGRAVQLLGPPGGSTGALSGGILAFQGLTGGITNLGKSQLDAVANSTSVEPVTVSGHNLTLEWKVADVLTVKSITGYRKFHQKPNIYDLGATGGLRFSLAQLGALLGGNVPGILDPGNQPGANDSFFTLMTARTTKQHQFSQEVQFLFNWDRFDLTSGVFYFHERSPATNYLGIFFPVANGVVKPTPFDALFGSGITSTIATNDSMAGYGQLTFHATDRLDLTFGGRYTIDDRATNLIAVTSGSGSGVVPGRTYKTSYTRFNYTGIVSYKVTPDTLAYAKIATGYVAGGLLSAIPYKPESLTSYEAGLKSQLFGNKLRANFAAFYSDYKDLQVQTFTGGVQRFENAGKARIWGLEGEFEAVPVEGLNLVANFGYTNFKYREYLQGGVNVASIVRPIYTPKWNVRLGGQYDFLKLDNGATAYVNVDARYRSGSPLSAFKTGNAAVDALAVIKKFILTDVRAGIASLPIAGTQVGIAGWAKNIFDVDRATFGPTAINQVVVPDRGRTYGVELTAKF